MNINIAMVLSYIKFSVILITLDSRVILFILHMNSRIDSNAYRFWAFPFNVCDRIYNAIKGRYIIYSLNKSNIWECIVQGRMLHLYVWITDDMNW